MGGAMAQSRNMWIEQKDASKTPPELSIKEPNGVIMHNRNLFNMLTNGDVNSPKVAHLILLHLQGCWAGR